MGYEKTTIASLLHLSMLHQKVILVLPFLNVFTKPELSKLLLKYILLKY